VEIADWQLTSQDDKVIKELPVFYTFLHISQALTINKRYAGRK